MRVYSSLEWIESIQVGYIKVTGSPFVNIKINCLGNFKEQSKFYNLTAFGYRKFCGGGGGGGKYHFSHTCAITL